jgi:hypothetical protein
MTDELTNLAETTFGKGITTEAVARFRRSAQEEAVRLNYDQFCKHTRLSLKARLLAGRGKREQ